MICQKTSALCYTMAILVLVSLLIAGCADREELEEARRQQVPGYNAEANEALRRAEKAMREADIEVNFSELNGLESLSDLRSILPDPMEIRHLEKQRKVEEAIGALYDALDALGKSGASLASPSAREREDSDLGSPSARKKKDSERVPEGALVDPDGASNSDLALIHFHLSYCYALAAVSRLARLGLGTDGVPNTADDLYHISFPEELKAKSLEVYRFMLTGKGQTLMDSVVPDVDPYGYIKVFYDEGQVEALQVILDSLLLLLGAEVAVMENPTAGIRAHEPKVDRQTYRQDALYHLGLALELARKVAPELEDALTEFDEALMEYFSRELLEDVIKWGFEVRKVPDRYKDLLDQ